MNKMLKAMLLTVFTATMIMGCGKSAVSNVAAKAVPEKAKGKVLIAYFSYSKDHNTRAAAEQIKQLTGGDLVEIVPKKPYPTDYDKTVEQGKQEVNSGFQPEITTKIADWNKYDTVIIGSPIWWYHISPPVKTFMQSHNFAGKQVALFVTNGGYGAGESGNDLKNNCKNAKILGNYAGPGADVAKDKGKIEQWLKEIGLL